MLNLNPVLAYEWLICVDSEHHNHCFIDFNASTKDSLDLT